MNPERTGRLDRERGPCSWPLKLNPEDELCLLEMESFLWVPFIVHGSIPLSAAQLELCTALIVLYDQRAALILFRGMKGSSIDPAVFCELRSRSPQPGLLLESSVLQIGQFSWA